MEVKQHATRGEFLISCFSAVVYSVATTVQRRERSKILQKERISAIQP